MSAVRLVAVTTFRALLARAGFSVVLVLSTPWLDRAQQGPSGGELLQQFENTRVFWQQIEVAKAIVAAHDASVLPKLEPWLTLEDRHLRGNAAFVFAGLGDPRGFEVIVAILNDRSERAPGQGAFYLNSGPDPGPDPKRLLAAEITSDRYYAAHLLGDLKDPRAVPILVRLLKDPDVNYIVPWSLGQIGVRSASPALIGALSDPNPDMRVLAISAIERLGATEALPRLRELLDDAQRSTFSGQVAVSEAARTAIDKLESQPSSPTRK
jgi:HEAT repeat protein